MFRHWSSRRRRCRRCLPPTCATRARMNPRHWSIGAFALRDAADVLTDVRWAMNRMTAHLAAAKALRADDHAQPDGAIAHVVLLVLANHQARALVELGSLGTGTPPEPMNAWVRAMQLRITQDWRALPEPARRVASRKTRVLPRAPRDRPAAARRRYSWRWSAKPVAADFMRIAQDELPRRRGRSQMFVGDGAGDGARGGARRVSPDAWPCLARVAARGAESSRDAPGQRRIRRCCRGAHGQSSTSVTSRCISAWSTATSSASARSRRVANEMQTHARRAARTS